MEKNYDIKLGVSLYSYQDNYYFHKHDLEGCMAAAAGSGAEGIEIFADAMIPEWPYISDAWVDRWNGLLERYGLKPLCLDHFSDRAMWHDKLLTDDQMYERGVMYIKAARKLGCPTVRLLHSHHAAAIGKLDLTGPKIVERLLPVAAENNVMMALECHAPTHIADPIHEVYLEAAERLHLPYVGLQADFSSYEYCMSTADIKEFTFLGCTEEILRFVREKQREAYRQERRFNFAEIADEVEKMHPTAMDREILFTRGSYHGTTYKFDGQTDPFAYGVLKDYASRLVYIHGKFYDIDENGDVDNMDYHKIFDALMAGGYKGYVSSEFEGNRRMNMYGWVDEIEYVRKHQLLMRRCLGRAG